MLWKYNYKGFDKICKSWNIAIRTLLRLPFNTHNLGSLIGHQHIRTQLYVRDFYYFCGTHIDLVMLLLKQPCIIRIHAFFAQYILFRYKMQID